MFLSLKNTEDVTCSWKLYTDKYHKKACIFLNTFIQFLKKWFIELHTNNKWFIFVGTDLMRYDSWMFCISLLYFGSKDILYIIIVDKQYCCFTDIPAHGSDCYKCVWGCLYIPIYKRNIIS